MTHLTINCQNLPCPQPILKIKEFISNNSQESCFLVVVDNQAAVENVTRFLQQNAYLVTSVYDHQSHLWTIKAIKSEEIQVNNTQRNAKSGSNVSLNTNSKTLIVITTPDLGRGDPGIGTKLMESFLSTLPEIEDSLWKIILLNGGVKLAAEDGPALSALQNLEKSGVEILVCSACLNFFGIFEKKKVGQTTNMLDVVCSLDVADKVIRL